MKTANVSESELVALAQGGDLEAFNRLVLAYQNKIFNSLYRMLGSYEEAEDLAQETFVRAYNSLKSFREDASFYTWLFRIAVNTGRSHMRTPTFRAKTVSIENTSGSDDEALRFDIADDSAPPTAKVDEDERSREIQQALNKLPDDARRVIVMRDIEGYNYREIASLTELDLGTVKSRLHRARMQLAELLGEDFQ